MCATFAFLQYGFCYCKNIAFFSYRNSYVICVFFSFHAITRNKKKTHLNASLLNIFGILLVSKTRIKWLLRHGFCQVLFLFFSLLLWNSKIMWNISRFHLKSFARFFFSHLFENDNTVMLKLKFVATIRFFFTVCAWYVSCFDFYANF